MAEDAILQTSSGKNSAKKKDDGKSPLWVVVLVVGFLLAMDYMVITGWIQIVDDFRLHFMGKVAKDGYCSIFHGSRTGESLNFYYSVAGVEYRVSHELGLTSVNEEKPCEVRYDPAFPSHAGSSWGFQKLPSRIVGITLPTLIFLLPSLVFAIGAVMKVAGWGGGSKSDAAVPLEN